MKRRSRGYIFRSVFITAVPLIGAVLLARAYSAGASAPRKAAPQMREIDRRLVEACESKQVEDVRHFLRAGANPNVRGTNGDPILMNALDGPRAIVKALLARGADPNSREASEWREPALSRAVIDHDDPTLVRLLLAYGADMEARDKDGSTALAAGLLVCGGCGCVSYVDSPLVLVDRGANVNTQDIRGDTPLMILISWGEKESLGLARAMLAHGAKVHLKNKKGQDAFSLAEIFFRNSPGKYNSALFRLVKSYDR